MASTWIEVAAPVPLSPGRAFVFYVASTDGLIITVETDPGVFEVAYQDHAFLPHFSASTIDGGVVSLRKTYGWSALARVQFTTLGGGGGGPSRWDAHYKHDQDVPSATWTVDHNLGKHPSVSILDSTGTEVLGGVLHVSVNRATLSFSAPFSGVATFN